MKHANKAVFVMVLLGASIHFEAVNAQQLLQEIDPAYAERLADYNSVFLQEATYAAARYRIVEPNAALLLRDSDITITPFPDVEPIRVRVERAQRQNEAVSWVGRIQNQFPALEGIDPEIARYALTARIVMQWWDLDEFGDARLSAQNQFQFSSRWQFDEQDRPVLRPPPVPAEGAEAFGPPPERPGDVAHHKELLKLDKHAFASVSATVSLPGGPRYWLIPLELTPKYSVIIEEDPGKRVRMLAESPRPGDSNISSDEQLRAQRYRQFVDSLPREQSKRVKDELR